MRMLLKMCTKNMGLWSLCRLCLFMSLFGISAQTFAQTNSIENVTASQQGNNVIVKVGLKNALTTPPLGFSTVTPARIALDFTSTSNGMGKSAIDINLGNVRTLNIVEAGERSRLVFNLTRPLNFASVVEGNMLIVTIEGSGDVATPVNSSGVPVPATTELTGKQALKDIDFRRGVSGEGRIIVDLPSKQIAIDVHQQGQTIVADFLKADLPEVLHRRMDVSDFGSPVQTITTSSKGDNVHMVIEPKGLWEHSVYQSDSRLVIEVKPIKEDPNKLTQGSQGYRGEKLSLNFQNVEVRSLLQVIAEVSGFNVIASDTVNGSITLRLKDIPWDQALEIIMQSKGLDMRKNGSVIWVAPKDELLTKEKLELEQKAQIAELEPLKTETYQLNYQKAEAFKMVFGLDGSSPGIRILSKRGSAVIDPRTNQLFVTDVASRLEEIAKLVKKTDIASRQVLIEARIVEATDDFSRNLGAKLGFTDNSVVNGTLPGSGLGGNARAAIGGTYQGVANQTGQLGSAAAVVTDVTAGQFFSLPAAAIGGVNPGSVALSLFSSGANKFLNLELSALEADGKGKIISSPRVVTADQIKAVVEQGPELPFQVATSSGATSITFKKANLKLEVTPQITPDGNVILDVDVNNDSPGILTTSGYAINSKHVKTLVMVENGGPVLRGGIFTQNVQDSETKIPLLGDIPFLGYLFKTSGKSDSKTELLIFITPKIVTNSVADAR